MSTCNRKEKDGTVVEVPIPTSTKLFNQYMNGVDHSDQLRSYYSYRLKSRKYYMYLFFFAFECCVTNASVLQKQYRSAPIKITKQYRLLLAEKLIGAYTSRHRYALPQLIQDTALLKSLPPRKRKIAEQTGVHFPLKTTSGRCSYCWNSKGVRHESSIKCRQCKVRLCVDDGILCFEKYHM